MKSPRPGQWLCAALVGVWAVMAAVPAVVSAQTALPTGQEIRERYVAALGGRAALQQPKSSYATGTFEVPAQALSGEFARYAAAPAKFLSTMNIVGVGEVRSGFDGDVGWMNNPMMGPMLLEGKQLQQLRQQADFYSLLNPEAHIASFEPVGETDFEGKACYEVKVTTHWDEQYTEYYEVESGLMAGSVRMQESAMGSMEATTVIVEYRQFGAILVPATVVQRAMTIETTISINAVEYDSVDEAVFELPPDIVALLAQPKDTTSGGDKH